MIKPIIVYPFNWYLTYGEPAFKISCISPTPPSDQYEDFEVLIHLTKMTLAMFSSGTLEMMKAITLEFSTVVSTNTRYWKPFALNIDAGRPSIPSNTFVLIARWALFKRGHLFTSKTKRHIVFMGGSAPPHIRQWGWWLRGQVKKCT